MSIVVVKNIYIQNKSKNNHLDFSSLAIQIVKSRLQNEQLKTIQNVVKTHIYCAKHWKGYFMCCVLKKCIPGVYSDKIC